MKPRHFISITDFSSQEILNIFSVAKKLKIELKEKGFNKELLKNKTLSMIFEKPSLRTRVSFEAGMTHLGGHAIYLGPSDIGMGKREKVSDIGKVLSGMTSIIMARTFSHESIVELAENSSVPVINGLSGLEHPCQALADMMTIWEKKEKLAGLTIAFVGDGDSNVAHSLCLLSAVLGINFKVASPEGYFMNEHIVAQAKKSGGSIFETSKPEEAVEAADVVITDTWVSMGDEEEKKKRLEIFKSYQVDQRLMQIAKKDAIFMHCLPAYRGNEVAAEVIDGPQSVVFEEAENRLHVQKALLLRLLNIETVSL